METQRFYRHSAPAILIHKKPEEIGVWHSCEICYSRRLDCSLASLTYRIPSIRNIARTIRYCLDNPECTLQAEARALPRPAIRRT